MARSLLYRWVILTIALLTVAPVGAWAQQPGKWALIVGVDRYDNADITQLQYAGADAKALASTLQQYAAFPANHIILMTSDQKGKERPTSANILGWMESLKAAVKPGDEFVFYFSGHGLTQDGQGFLLTADTNLGSRLLLAKSALAINEVREALQELRVGKMMQILDACRNDPRGGHGGDNPLSSGLARDLKVTARPGVSSSSPNAVPGVVSSGSGVEVAATMFACAVGERSFEGYQGHGYFTYFLCEGLKGAAADQSGQITIPSLDEYVRNKVLQAVSQREIGHTQRPWVELSGGTTWVLAQGNATRTAAAPISAPEQKAVTFSKLYQDPDKSVGAWRAYFLTPHGEVEVYLPDDMAKGDQISGMILEHPPVGTKEERSKHLEALSEYSLDLGGGKISPLSNGVATWKVPMQPGKPLLRLIDPQGAAIASVSLPVAEHASAAPSKFGFPDVVVAHNFPLEGFQITGPFDGNLTDTKITSNGKDMDKLAESPRKCVVLPNDLVMNVQVEEGGKSDQHTIHALVPDFRAQSLSALKVSVLGLKGIDTKAFPLTINVMMTGENEITFDKSTFARTWPLVISSSDVKPDGTAVYQVPIRGGRAGDQIQLTSYIRDQR